jgi:cytolysin-activating lysine-acyltransferase
MSEDSSNAAPAADSVSRAASTGAPPPAGVPHTAAEALGQIIGLLSQSPLHRELKIKDLEWSFLPPIRYEQFRIFRFGPLPGAAKLDPAQFGGTALTRESMEQLPLGVAIWGKLSAAAEAKLEKGERLAPQEWRSGDHVWLIELISPFSTPENKLAEAMLLDLMQGPFRETPFNLHRTDPATGRRDKVRISSHLKGAARGA